METAKITYIDIMLKSTKETQSKIEFFLVKKFS